MISNLNSNAFVINSAEVSAAFDFVSLPFDLFNELLVYQQPKTMPVFGLKDKIWPSTEAEQEKKTETEPEADVAGGQEISICIK